VENDILNLKDVLEDSSFGIEFFDWTDKNIFDHLLAYVMDRSDHPVAEHLGILLKAIKGRVLYRKVLDYPLNTRTDARRLRTYKEISALESEIAKKCGLNETIDVIVSCPNTSLRAQLSKPANLDICVDGIPLFLVSEDDQEAPSLSIRKLIGTWQDLQVVHIYVRSIPGLDFIKIENACKEILECLPESQTNNDYTK
jgi:hypothetical protein